MTVRLFLVTIQPAVQFVTNIVPSEVKRAEHKAHHSPAPSVQVKNATETDDAV
jgi:hypothetical protein